MFEDPRFFPALFLLAAWNAVVWVLLGERC